jgi:chemotaxis protein histidine kinase CheA
MTTTERYALLMEAFLLDAAKQMGALLEARVVLETAPADGDAWDQVRRGAHTIAGNAAMMGFDDVVRAGRSLERRAIAVAERGGAAPDVWTLDGERKTLDRLLATLDVDVPRAGAAA